MKYGVVIVTYNRLELLKECLQQCFTQTYPFSSVIVVDNDSDDGTGAYLDELREKQENLIVRHLSENTGGSGGFKRALQIARRMDLDWILIIDDDAMIASDYIEQCNRYLKRHPNVAACSGTVYTNGEIQLNHRRRIISKVMHFESNVPLSGYEHTSFHYDLATFCGLMIRGDVLREIGLPKSEYFIWYDDTEYSMRLKKYGGITNINAAKLNHKTVLPGGEHAGFFMRMNWRTYYGHRNRLDAVRKHCGFATQLVIYAEFAAFIGCGIVMSLLPNYHKQGVFVTRMLVDALRDGAMGKLGKNEKYLPN